MRNTKNLKLFTAALLLASAVPAFSSQTAGQSTKQYGPLEVIALQTYVDGRQETYGIKPAEPIPVRPGEKVRIHLVGTAIVNGNGVEKAIPARFSVAAGRGQIDIVQTGASWALVEVRGGANGIAQLGYAVTGNNYEMKGSLREGRITLEIGSGVGTSPGSVGSGSVDRDRWNQAQDLRNRLYHSILGTEPRGDVAQRDLEHIYTMGEVGVRDVALALANDASSRYDRLSQNEAVDVVGRLYRGLLRRDGNNDRFWSEDPGFRANVETLRRNGYRRLIEVIVEAPEFRTANNLNPFGSLAGQDDRGWRSDRDRYAIPRY